MKKKVIVNHTDLDMHNLLSGNLNDVIDGFKDLAEIHGGDAEVEIEYDYDHCELYVITKRDETDEEYDKRMETNKKAKERRVRNAIDKKLRATEMKRAEYEKLKEIFEGE